MCGADKNIRGIIFEVKFITSEILFQSFTQYTILVGNITVSAITQKSDVQIRPETYIRFVQPFWLTHSFIEVIAKTLS